MSGHPNSPLPFPAGQIHIPLGGRLELRLYVRPGERLSGAGRERLVRELRRVTAACLGGRELRYGLLSGRRERLARAVIAVLRDTRTGDVVAFNAATILSADRGQGCDVPVLHSGLCMILPEHRGRGATRLLASLPVLAAFLRGGLKPLWVTNVSQVPAAVGIFGEAVADLAPSPDGTLPSDAHVRIARQLMDRHREAFGVGDDAELDADLLIIRNAYTGGSDDLKKRWCDAALHREPRWNELCRERLDYDRGDDLFQIGRFTIGQAALLAWRFFERVIRGSIETLAKTAASALAPLVGGRPPLARTLGRIR
jgi:hypothetical protein